ncbi:MAG: phosphate ABC transporter permease PstA [Alkalinema sp. RL_2_19]|nr:phosphate ABC transporter permease PstA [Alkalinema sp. RL_2_19]
MYMVHQTASQAPQDMVMRPLAPGRSWFEQGMTIISYGLTLLALLPLISLVWKIVREGMTQLNWHTLTQSLLDEPIGFANVILGTIMIVLVAAAFSLPVGVITAVYLSEFGKNSRIAQVIRFTVKIISAVPSIVMGVFAYAVIVIPLQRPSALAGSFALAVLMLPMVILAAEEALKLIPDHQRAGSVALGANQLQTTLRVVIAPALPGITTASLLAIARAAGETAPLIFTAQFSQNYPDGLLQPSPSLSVMIYNYANSPELAQTQLAWTASLVLLMLVTALSVGARLVVKRSSDDR